MSPSTIAACIAAGLAVAAATAGGIALWLRYRSKATEPTNVPQTPAESPHFRRRRSDWPDLDSFDESTLFGSGDRSADDEPEAAPPPVVEREPERPKPEPAPAPRIRVVEREPDLWEPRAANDSTPERDQAKTLRIQTPPRTTIAAHRVRTSAPLRSPSETPIVASNQKQRYTVATGETIEIPLKKVPTGAQWQASRDDVDVQLLGGGEGDDRIRFALRGPSGPVEIALVRNGRKASKKLRTFKFDLRESAA